MKLRRDDGIRVPRRAYRDAEHRLQLLLELAPRDVQIRNRPWRRTPVPANVPALL